MPLRWFDAHLDLAYLAENGRDMARPPGRSGGPHPPAAVTLPSLAEGGVAACLGTIFTEAGGNDAVAYPPGDAPAAYAAGVRQLEHYRRWAEAGRVRPQVVRMSERERPPAGDADPASPGSRPLTAETPSSPVWLGILVECADPIRTPDELPWWAGQGVVAIGMAWARGSRYAAGNAAPAATGERGLTPLGRELARRMDALGIVHDLSHLSQAAADELLALTPRPVVATHSNCRELLDGRNERHLADETIREIGRRGGVIGLNLYAPFLRHGLAESQRPTIDDAVRHVEHVAALMGHRRGVGLGSDMDGGFSAERLPAGIDRPADLERLADALSDRGWSDADIAGFAWSNWARFFGLDAPVTAAAGR